MKENEYNFQQMDKEIYQKALDLKDSLTSSLSGATHEMAICYALVNAIENIKKQLIKKHDDNT